jgi:hypothetical protein
MGRIENMTRNLKALGLALIAIFAFGAVAASAASAETLDHFTSSNAKTTLTGEQVGSSQENILLGIKEASSFYVKCENSKVKFHGTVVGTSVTEVTLHPTYEGCVSPIASATVTTTGCNYILKGTTDEYTNTSGTEEGKDATLDIECEINKSITITTGGCTITIGNVSGPNPVNQNLLGAKYTNVAGTPKTVTVDVTVDKIHFTSSGFPCALAGITPTGIDAFMTERVTLRGYEDTGTENTPVNIEVS